MPHVLLVGCDPAHTRDIRTVLRGDGHRVTLEANASAWPARERESRPDLIVAAVDSPRGLLGGNRRVAGFPAPMLLVRHDHDFESQPESEDRLVDCMSTPFLADDLLARVDALVRVRQIVQSGSPGKDPSGERAGVAARIAALFGAGKAHSEKPPGPYLEVASRVAEWTDRRDAFEPGHAERVTSICAMIADGLGLDAHDTSCLLRAAMLHDIGKVGMPRELLHQTTPLEEGQIRMLRTHTRRGAALLRALDRNEEVASTVLYHHERPDGTGYHGLDGERIPRMARILSVAEVYDAMTTTRLADPVSPTEALDRMERCKGSTLDSDCVEVLVDRLRPKSKGIPLSIV